jgi:hypothetical protein
MKKIIVDWEGSPSNYSYRVIRKVQNLAAQISVVGECDDPTVPLSFSPDRAEKLKALFRRLRTLEQVAAVSHKILSADPETVINN